MWWRSIQMTLAIHLLRIFKQFMKFWTFTSIQKLNSSQKMFSSSRIELLFTLYAPFILFWMIVSKFRDWKIWSNRLSSKITQLHCTWLFPLRIRIGWFVWNFSASLITTRTKHEYSNQNCQLENSLQRSDNLWNLIACCYLRIRWLYRAPLKLIEVLWAER